MYVRIQVVIIFLCVLAGINQSCKSPQGKQSMEEYLPYTPKESIIRLPLTAHLDSLGQLLDQQLDTLLQAEGGNFSDGDLEVQVKKLGTLYLSVDGSQLNYRLPLALDLAYDATVTTLQAIGEIELDFSTQYEIDSTWNLATQTTLSQYNWLKEPKLKVGFVSLPGSLVADWVIQFGKQEVARLIDQQVRENVPLRDWITEAWNVIREPVLLEEELSAWMIANPRNLAITPISTTDRQLKMILQATCNPFVQVGPKPDSLFKHAPLPPLEFIEDQGEPTGFSLFVRTALPYEEAEAIARENLLEEEFSAGKRSVKIDALSLYGEKDKLIVSADMSGSYTGKVELSGKPMYREKGNRIVLKDLDYTLKTKNFLHKTAGWVMKSTLLDRMQKELDFFLDSNLTEWKELLQNQLDEIEIEEGIDLGATVNKLEVEDTFLTADAIVVDVGLSGDIALNLRQF